MIFYYTNSQSELLKEVEKEFSDITALGEFKYRIASVASYYKLPDRNNPVTASEKYRTIFYVHFKTSLELTKMLNNDILMLKCEDSVENANFSISGDVTVLQIIAETLLEVADLIRVSFAHFLANTLSINIVTEIPYNSEQDEEMLYTRKFSDLFIQTSANTDTKVHIIRDEACSNEEFYMLLAVLLTKYLNVLTPKKIYLAFSLDYDLLIADLLKVTGITYTKGQIDEIIIQN